MSIENYLTGLIHAQRIPESYERELQKDRERIEKIVYDIEDLVNPTPYYGGSKGKNTMVKESYDLDIVLYYPSEEDHSVEKIQDMVFDALVDSELNPVRKNVAIRVLKRSDYHIDVVPGKRIKGSDDDAYIYKSETNKRFKTSVKKHIESIRESAERGVLKLMKLWKIRNCVVMPSFVLEQITIKALEKVNNSVLLEHKLKIVFEFIVKNLLTINLPDPANPSNIITDEEVISLNEKRIAVGAARWTIEDNDLTKLNGWQEIFKKKEFPPYKIKTNSTSEPSSKNINQEKPRLSPDSPGRRFANE
ncbi:MAG: hypothetical protein ACFFCS_29010 [Candidatus Hodarchaeota archaeon]